MEIEYDIIIVGAGLVGLTAALALGQAGHAVALVDAQDFDTTKSDPRASTLAASSAQLMKNLGLWEAIAADVQPINDMMIGEGRPGRISPLTLHFDGAARGTPMAYMIENQLLKTALQAAVLQTDSMSLKLGQAVTQFTAKAGHAEIRLDNDEALTAPLIIAADGRKSTLRKLANIAVETNTYEQSAIVTTVAHEKPHGGVAQQLFFAGGPFAILPLSNNRSSLVWSDSHKAASAAMALPEDMFCAEISRRFGDHLGQLTVAGPKLTYPLSLQMAESYTSDRLALVGDAAHVVHPIAGQGLNMGLRDAAALADIIAGAKSTGLDIGGAELESYAQWRRGDNRTLGVVTDQLNSLFSNRIAPLRHLRRLGLASIDRTGLAQDFFMAEAAGELGELPSLLRV